MFADRAEDQLLDFGGGHAVELGGLVRLPLNKARRAVGCDSDQGR
jgi:hypothetical protein